MPVSTSKTGANVARAAIKPLRVLHVNNGSDIYGASRSLLRLCTTVDRRRFEPVVVLPEAGPLKDLLEAEGVEVVLHPGLSVITRPVFRSWRLVMFFLNYPRSVLFLRRLIRKKGIRLVHTNTGVIISPALAARLAGVPHLWHVREWFQEFQRIWFAFTWYMRTFSDRIIANSNAVAGQFSSRNKVVVIHNGFSVEEFQVPKERLRAEWRNRYKLDSSFVVGCVGRIKLVRKGQEILVQATALLKRRGRPVKAFLVGAPFPGNEAHLEQLQQIVRELGVEDRVVFAGELADVRPAYAAMDAFALTSVQPEPLGNVLMEAMAMRLPVVATNVGGPLDIVEPGVSGLLVRPGDPTALANAIEKLMDDPGLSERLGAGGFDRIQNHFSIAETTRAFERLLEETISSPQ